MKEEREKGGPYTQFRSLDLKESRDSAERPAGKITITSGLLLERSEVLRSLKHYLRAQSQEHHTIDRLHEKSSNTASA